MIDIFKIIAKYQKISQILTNIVIYCLTRLSLTGYRTYDGAFCKNSFAKRLILDVWLGSKYVSVHPVFFSIFHLLLWYFITKANSGVNICTEKKILSLFVVGRVPRTFLKYLMRNNFTFLNGFVVIDDFLRLIILRTGILNAAPRLWWQFEIRYISDIVCFALNLRISSFCKDKSCYPHSHY